MRKALRRTRAIVIAVLIFIAINIGLNVLFNVVGLISTDTLSNYSATGNAVLLVLLMLFAAWAWWYGEDRDRRARLQDPQHKSPGDPG